MLKKTENFHSISVDSIASLTRVHFGLAFSSRRTYIWEIFSQVSKYFRPLAKIPSSTIRAETKVHDEWSPISLVFRFVCCRIPCSLFLPLLFFPRSWQFNALIAEGNNVRDGEDIAMRFIHTHIHRHIHTLYIFIHKCIIYR